MAGDVIVTKHLTLRIMLFPGCDALKITVTKQTKTLQNVYRRAGSQTLTVLTSILLKLNVVSNNWIYLDVLSCYNYYFLIEC